MCTVVITVVILFDEEKKENSNLLKYVPYWPQQNHIPDEFAVIKTNPAKALRNIAETNEELLNLLGNFVHRFIPGRRYVDGDIPNTDDIVLFVTKEAERTRNIGYQYGRVVELHVDGRANKVLVEYQNSNEVVKRKTTRNVKDLVLIHSSDELDFNTSEHMLAAAIQQKYLHFSY